MSESPWISILLPVFDVGAALDTCLASILDQDVAGVELVIVDDASSADDAARIESWRARRPDVMRVVRHARNQGVAAARNTLLDEARGEWLWFVDPDDVVAPGALASLRTIVETSAPDLVMCDFRTFDDAPEAPGAAVAPASVRRPHVRTFEGPSDTLSSDRAALVAGLFRTGQLHPWSKIVRRETWPATLRFPAGRVFEDLAVFPRVALAARTHLHVPRVWISYRQRAGSVLASLDERKLDDWTFALAGFARDLRESPVPQDTGMLFEVSHFCARTLLRAIRRHRRLPSRVGERERLRGYVERWRESSPLDADALARAYLARGMVGRWAQWRWTLWRLAR
ncbi:glycosyltransferase family 2 protein [Scleromatobacter humisilvae]|uniref:Glycosyltransferase n=1 Tax=Scleromatobacter humisilvae TaxID=2897159 RepID=A0A9X1YGE7_9BURK|nr:glycosyltransferase [Scleromatobacter humisilvae]MCK9684960.1 glycosyltransferase [Scleromatobacter humisilvae]